MRRVRTLRTVATLALAAAMSSLHLVAPAVGAEPLRNWFGDPYFRVRDGLPGCPVPQGPLATEAESLGQAHSRSERGTRCWQEKKCSKPSSYLYDPEIAEAVRARFAATGALRQASLWVTVQRRIVWVEGCVLRAYKDGQIERLLRGVPDVELLLVSVTRDPGGRPPYRALAPDAVVVGK